MFARYNFLPYAMPSLQLAALCNRYTKVSFMYQNSLAQEELRVTHIGLHTHIVSYIDPPQCDPIMV